MLKTLLCYSSCPMWTGLVDICRIHHVCTALNPLLATCCLVWPLTLPSPPLQRLTLLHVNSNQCLDMPSDEDKMVPTLRDCNGSRSQQWILRNMTLSQWAALTLHDHSTLNSDLQPRLASHPRGPAGPQRAHDGDSTSTNHTPMMPLVLLLLLLGPVSV